jgi:adenine-specific DNA-methyltransferase
MEVGEKPFLAKYKTEIEVKCNNGVYRLYKKRRLTGAGKKPKTTWIDSKYDASSHGIMLMAKLFGSKDVFSYPKSIDTVKDALFISTENESLVLDFFAGFIPGVGEV